MALNSCIVQVPRGRFLAIRKEYLEICEGSHAAAAVLAVLEYLTNVALGNCQRRSQAAWITPTIAEIGEETFGLFTSRNAILPALETLKRLGFLEIRQSAGRVPNAFLLLSHAVNTALGFPDPAPAEWLNEPSQMGEMDLETLPNGTVQGGNNPPKSTKHKEVELESQIDVSEKIPRPALESANLADEIMADIGCLATSSRNLPKTVTSFCAEHDLALRLDQRLKRALRDAEEKARGQGQEDWLAWRQKLALAIMAATENRQRAVDGIKTATYDFLRAKSGNGRAGIERRATNSAEGAVGNARNGGQEPLHSAGVRKRLEEMALAAGCGVVNGDGGIASWQWNNIGGWYLGDEVGCLAEAGEIIRRAGAVGESFGAAMKLVDGAAQAYFTAKRKAGAPPGKSPEDRWLEKRQREREQGQHG